MCGRPVFYMEFAHEVEKNVKEHCALEFFDFENQ